MDAIIIVGFVVVILLSVFALGFICGVIADVHNYKDDTLDIR